MNIYIGLPLSGDRGAEGRAIADGARLALARAGDRAGAYAVRALFLDDTGGGRRWSLAASAANARRAAEDSSAIGFIGDLDSGATRASLPITNQAGIVQISPGSTAVDLTRRVSEQLTPERYRPEDESSFVRLVRPADRLGGASPFIPPAELSAPGGFDFPAAYERRYGRPPLPPAAYGYEAMDLLLDAIASAGDSRGDVRDEVLATQDRRSIIGTYSFDDSGDIHLSR